MLPIFLQSLHGFTAWQTGKVILPGALASAFTMAIVGRNAQKLDARYTIVGGAALFMMSMWLMSRITLDSGTNDLFWPLVLRGVGLGLIFVPLTSASMAELSVRQLAQGTGLYNLKTLAGAGASVGAIDIAGQARIDMIANGLMARGINPLLAKQQALFILDRQISAQASVLAFSKIYLLNGIILLCALPLLLLWKTGRGRGSTGPAH